MIGGAIFAMESTINITGNCFSYNKASSHRGAAIYQERGHLYISDSNFTNNQAHENYISIVYGGNLILNCSGYFNFLNNTGSFTVFNSQVHIKGTAKFTNNTSLTGGAIGSVQSQITFHRDSTIVISGNKATYGGGLSLQETTLNIYCAIDIENNSASSAGGGIHAYQSQIIFRMEPATSIATISGNKASDSGGGVHAIASSIQVSSGLISFETNTATLYGGALFFIYNSKIYVKKLAMEEKGDWKVRLVFKSNLAQVGGAIYIFDSTGYGSLCESPVLTNECFLQTISLYSNNPNSINIKNYNIINTFFENNTATHSGSDIYGGLLDRCTMSPLAEIYHSQPRLNGLDYFLYTVRFDYRNASVLRTKKKISSDAVQVCFCLDNLMNCTYNHPTVFARKGEEFNISIIAVDQMESPINTTVITSFSSKQGKSRLSEGQGKQLTGDQCSTLQYNVYSTASEAQIQLYADGPCRNLGMSKRDLNITFLPCICPNGFQQSRSPIDCICECDQRLKPYVTDCSQENKTILVETNVWIQYINTTNDTGYVIEHCPFDYCVEKPVNISLNSANEDQQCNYNRTRNLCGECKEGLSLVFASSQCLVCTNYYIFLLIPFALAGVALIGFILLLNMTVATGTLHGLIFYTNILSANHSMFLPFKTPNVLTVFVSWINLDLGIETCFYDGMNSFGKVLLQIVFPAYLFLLIGTIIILCEYSNRLSAFLGKRNPVAALCTVILLSYSKLLCTIIAALELTYLRYPDGSHETVWLYDANVPYFSANHIPRFIVASIIITLGAVYTTLLFFGQWLHTCSNWKVMKWVRNTKYNSFIDAYHAPFSPKHRYWVGLLLLTRIIHYLVSSFTSDSDTILSVGIIVFGLLLLKLITSRIYKSWVLDTLETSFLINLGVLSLGTLYLLPNGNQTALANTSMAISFFTFLGVVCYNAYRYIIKDTRVWRKLIHLLRRRPRYNQLHTYQLSSIDGERPILDSTESAEILYDQQEEIEQEQVYTDDSTLTNDDQLPIFEPPIIRSCVPMDQLREPALDDLAPVTADDYTIPPNAPTPTVVTYSVVDIGRSE